MFMERFSLLRGILRSTDACPSQVACTEPGLSASLSKSGYWTLMLRALLWSMAFFQPTGHASSLHAGGLEDSGQGFLKAVPLSLAQWGGRSPGCSLETVDTAGSTCWNTEGRSTRLCGNQAPAIHQLLSAKVAAAGRTEPTFNTRRPRAITLRRLALLLLPFILWQGSCPFVCPLLACCPGAVGKMEGKQPGSVVGVTASISLLLILGSEFCLTVTVTLEVVSQCLPLFLRCCSPLWPPSVATRQAA